MCHRRLVMVALAMLTCAADAAPLQGTIKGLILDHDTQRPLVGANVLVIDHALGGIAGADGRFTTNAVPAGVHSLQLSTIGYETAIRTDIVVRPNRITTVRCSPSARSMVTWPRMMFPRLG